MTTIANLRARFTGDTSGFDKAAGRVSKGIGGIRNGVAALVGVAGVGGMVALARSTINQADQFQKLNQRLGVSTEALSEMRHVTELSGVSFQTFTTGVQRMTRRISEASKGSGVAVKALAELKIPIKDIKDLKPEQQFEVIADTMQGVENQADKVRLAMALFDTEGVSLLQTMTNGAKGIREMRGEAKKLGLTVTQDMANKAAEANDAIAKLTARWQGFRDQFVLDNLDGIMRGIDFIHMFRCTLSKLIFG